MKKTGFFLKRLFDIKSPINSSSIAIYFWSMNYNSNELQLQSCLYMSSKKVNLLNSVNSYEIILYKRYFEIFDIWEHNGDNRIYYWWNLWSIDLSLFYVKIKLNNCVMKHN